LDRASSVGATNAGRDEAAPNDFTGGGLAGQPQAAVVPTTQVPAWPVFVSSAAFALAHGGTWPDPLPLVVLAVVLGYVYRATHRLLPCVVLHCLFNALTLALVLLAS
jgi:hypothetical protein